MEKLYFKKIRDKSRLEYLLILEFIKFIELNKIIKSPQLKKHFYDSKNNEIILEFEYISNLSKDCNLSNILINFNEYNKSYFYLSKIIEVLLKSHSNFKSLKNLDFDLDKYIDNLNNTIENYYNKLTLKLDLIEKGFMYKNKNNHYLINSNNYKIIISNLRKILVNLKEELFKPIKKDSLDNLTLILVDINPTNFVFINKKELLNINDIYFNKTNNDLDLIMFDFDEVFIGEPEYDYGNLIMNFLPNGTLKDEINWIIDLLNFIYKMNSNINFKININKLINYLILNLLSNILYYPNQKDFINKLNRLLKFYNNRRLIIKLIEKSFLIK